MPFFQNILNLSSSSSIKSSSSSSSSNYNIAPSPPKTTLITDDVVEVNSDDNSSYFLVPPTSHNNKRRTHHQHHSKQHSSTNVIDIIDNTKPSSEKKKKSKKKEIIILDNVVNGHHQSIKTKRERSSDDVIYVSSKKSIQESPKQLSESPSSLPPKSNKNAPPMVQSINNNGNTNSISSSSSSNSVATATTTPPATTVVPKIEEIQSPPKSQQQQENQIVTKIIVSKSPNTTTPISLPSLPSIPPTPRPVPPIQIHTIINPSVSVNPSSLLQPKSILPPSIAQSSLTTTNQRESSANNNNGATNTTTTTTSTTTNTITSANGNHLIPISSNSQQNPLPNILPANNSTTGCSVEQMTHETLDLIENIKGRVGFISVTCPLSRKIICQPVLASDGIIYDRPSIISYMAEFGGFSPIVTGCKISESSLINVETVYSKAVSMVESKLEKIIELIQRSSFTTLSQLIPHKYLELIKFGIELMEEVKLKTIQGPTIAKIVEIMRAAMSRLLPLERNRIRKQQQQGTIIDQIFPSQIESYDLYKLGFTCDDIEQVVTCLLISNKEGKMTLDLEKRATLIMDLFNISNQSLPKMVSNFNIEHDFGIIFEMLVTLMQRNVCKFEAISKFLIQQITEANKGVQLDNPFYKQMIFFRDQLVSCRRELE